MPRLSHSTSSSECAISDDIPLFYEGPTSIPPAVLHEDVSRLRWSLDTADILESWAEAIRMGIRIGRVLEARRQLWSVRRSLDSPIPPALPTPALMGPTYYSPLQLIWKAVHAFVRHVWTLVLS